MDRHEVLPCVAFPNAWFVFLEPKGRWWCRETESPALKAARHQGHIKAVTPRGDETSPLPPLGPSPPPASSRDSTHSSTSAASSPRTERRSHPLAPVRATEVQLVRRPPGKSAHLPHHGERRSRGRRSRGKASPTPFAVRARVCTVPPRCGYPARPRSGPRPGTAMEATTQLVEQRLRWARNLLAPGAASRRIFTRRSSSRPRCRKAAAQSP